MKPAITTGYTIDGREMVYARLFVWKDERGLPIEVSAHHMLEQGLVPDWLYEVEGALWLGYTKDKILAELREVFQFLYPEKCAELIEKMGLYFELRETPNTFTLEAIQITKP